LLVLWLVASPVGALYVRPELERVPVERLIKNLEELAQKNAKDVAVRYNLARVHGMAWALKSDTCEVQAGKLQQGAWFGFEPLHVPYKAVSTKDEDKLAQAKKHLEKSMAAYQEVLKLQPDNLAARLGLAWSIDQSGNKEAAIKAYREVIAKGWEKEMKLKFGPLGARYITTEAAGYLIPLLDKERDQEEIETLRQRSAQLNKLPRPITPIAIPLRDGLTARDLEDRSAKVLFDADGSGLRKRWTWITPQAGWLVFDPQGQGEITSALQMFGSVGFWLFWDNGYQALASLDDDHDGVLTGKELAGLALWQDANGNGLSEPGEVRPLSSHGIVGLSCRLEREAGHPDRIWFSPRGVTLRDGRTRPSYDIILRPR
jgi:tetratricopeptide (TPR) repeat protein